MRWLLTFFFLAKVLVVMKKLNKKNIKKNIYIIYNIYNIYKFKVLFNKKFKTYKLY